MDDAVHDLLWSLWSELGVPGAVRRHRGQALDPEVLVVHTPGLVHAEPRLLGLAFDWCRTNSGWLSKTRLATLAKHAPTPIGTAFAAFAQDLARAGTATWRPREGSLGLHPDREAIHVQLERPSAVRFRLRAIAGVSTRAEVLACLIAAEHGGTAPFLHPRGVSRPSVDRDLAELLAAGMTVVDGPTRGRRHRLRRREAWLEVLDARGLSWPDWAGLFQIVSSVNSLRRMQPHRASTRVAASGLRDELTQLAARAGVEQPPVVVADPDVIENLTRWCMDVVAGIAGQ